MSATAPTSCASGRIAGELARNELTEDNIVRLGMHQ